MKLAKSQLKKIERSVQKIYQKNNDPYHHFNHAFRTAKLAAYIAKKEKANQTVCYVAGLVHDISPKTRGETHGLASSRMAEKLLRKQVLDRYFIRQVCQAIKYHDTAARRKIKTSEGKIVFDADKLQCLGPVGAIREYGDYLKLSYGHTKVIKITLDYLKNNNPPLFTKTGRSLKIPLKKFNLEFVRLYNEYK
ncbi:MAG: HD domain-containing protein [Patescibacteria group bacterium]